MVGEQIQSSDKRFRKPQSRPYSGLRELTGAHSSKGLRETRALVAVGWNELECGGVEHKMSTLALRSRKESS